MYEKDSRFGVSITNGKRGYYLYDNRHGLADYRLNLGEKGKGLRRTGAMEGNVNKLVARRMKNQGMSWSLNGIRRLLCIRFLVLEWKLDDWLSEKKSEPRLVFLQRGYIKS